MTNLPALRLKFNQKPHCPRLQLEEVPHIIANQLHQPPPQTAPSQTRYPQIMICTCVRTCRRCDHQAPPSRPGRSEHGWKPSRPSIPQEPVPHTRAPARQSSVGNPVHEGAISSHRLNQEEFKHRRSHTLRDPRTHSPTSRALAPPS